MYQHTRYTRDRVSFQPAAAPQMNIGLDVMPPLLLTAPALATRTRFRKGFDGTPSKPMPQVFSKPSAFSVNGIWAFHEFGFTDTGMNNLCD
jgi:hypothetical protein